MAEAVEEVGELAEEREYLYEYDSMVHTQHDQNIIYQVRFIFTSWIYSTQ